jgi:hypothetical protein
MHATVLATDASGEHAVMVSNVWWSTVTMIPFGHSFHYEFSLLLPKVFLIRTCLAPLAVFDHWRATKSRNGKPVRSTGQAAFLDAGRVEISR